MRKLLLFLISVFLLPAVLALPEGTYGDGLYGKGLYGVQSSAKATFTADVVIPFNTSTNIEANQSNTTLEIVADSSYSGFVTIVRYDSAPSGTGSSPASSLNKYVSISTEAIDLNYSVIKVRYSDNEVASSNLVESSMRLYRWNGSNWLVFDGASGGIDTSNNLVFANTTSFSVWGVFGSTVPSPAPSSAPSGGGGGGGGGGYYEPPKKEVVIDSQTVEISLSQGESYKITFKNSETHNLTLNKFYSDRVDVNMLGKFVTLHIKDTTIFSSETKTSVIVTLTRIIGGSATFTVKDITDYSKFGIIEEKPAETIEGVNLTEEQLQEVGILPPEVPEEAPEKPKYKFGFWQFLGAVAIILIIVGIFLNMRKKDKEKENNKNASNKEGNQREDKH